MHPKWKSFRTLRMSTILFNCRLAFEVRGDEIAVSNFLLSFQQLRDSNMKGSRVFSQLIAFLVVVVSLGAGAPMFGEDDEYDDDPELPDRKQHAMQKLKEQMEKAGSTTSTSTTPATPQSQIATFYRPSTNWIHSREMKGYEILSDGPEIHAELVRTRPMLRIRVNTPGSVRDVEKTLNRRYLELKIRHWKGVHKVHVKVPFGYQPEDLRVVEQKDHIDIVAPVYSDVDENSSER